MFLMRSKKYFKVLIKNNLNLKYQKMIVYEAQIMNIQILLQSAKFT